MFGRATTIESKKQGEKQKGETTPFRCLATLEDGRIFYAKPIHSVLPTKETKQDNAETSSHAFGVFPPSGG